ncbi:MAG: type II secretion system F family protein [Planctomycetes bacterium]|nr:type II secretion system F family protein [Planctomycetota bacterium]
MRTYSYQALDAQGRRVSGEIEATDPDAVVAQLTARGLRIEAVRELPAIRAFDEGALGRHSLSAADTREISGHISEIISAGAPLETGLAAIAEEFPASNVSDALRDIVARLESGQDLETVLRDCRTGAYLPALIRAGQRSGRTPEILDNFIAGSQATAELRQTWWMAMAYPLLLLAALGPLFFVLVFRVMPQFEELFAGFGMQLNLFTSALLKFGAFLRLQSLWIGIAVTLFSATTAFVLFAVLDRIMRRRLVCNLPFLGRVFRWSAFARFSPLLSALIEARIPLPEALLLAGDGSGDAELAEECRELAAELNAGRSLQESIGLCRRLPKSFCQALTWQEQRENLPDLLRSMADLYAGRVRALLMLLAAILPPVLLVFVAATIGIVVVLLFFPLLELMQKLS